MKLSRMFVLLALLGTLTACATNGGGTQAMNSGNASYQANQAKVQAATTY